PIRSESGSRKLRHPCCRLRMINDRRVSELVVQLICCAVHAGGRIEHFLNSAHQIHPCLRGHRSYGSFHIALRGDDIECGPRMERADRDDVRENRVGISADERLKVYDEMRTDCDRVDRLMRQSAMSALTVNTYGELV